LSLLQNEAITQQNELEVNQCGVWRIQI